MDSPPSPEQRPDDAAPPEALSDTADASHPVDRPPTAPKPRPDAGSGPGPAADADPGADPAPDGAADPGPLPRQRVSRGHRARMIVARSVVRSPAGGGVEPLIAVHRATFPRADTAMLRAAYEVAERAHRGQRRTSGRPYITHPLAVATILADLGMDTTTLVAALLHDTVEDTDYTLADARAQFGAEVAHLVDGVTKIDKVAFGTGAEAETFRKLLVWAARDIRVLVIKLADRLHNMRTLGVRPRHKQLKTARITSEVLIPLTERLGIQVLKRELEDLVFAIVDPERHALVSAELRARAASSRGRLDAMIGTTTADLRDARVAAAVSHRPRHTFSAYQSMRRSGDGSLGTSAVERLLVVVSGEPHDCYVALGVLHNRFTPVPGRFKDYIATPKFNLYQSLHTAVVGPDGETVEVLVRTEQMHRRSEYGIAAAIQEASGDGSGPLGHAHRAAHDLAWMRRLLQWQRQAADPEEFLASLTLDLSEGEIIVFTPTGEAMSLPARATPVDFAYAVRTDIGHRAVGSRVNGRLVPLLSALREGDVVEIIVGESDRPSAEWLTAVRTPQARLRIRQWQRVQRREEAIEAGRRRLGAALAARGTQVPDALVRVGLELVAGSLGRADQDDLLVAVHDGAIAVGDVADALAGLTAGDQEASVGERGWSPS